MYGVTVHFADLPGTLRGKYEATNNRIYLRRNLSNAQLISALAHELVHAQRNDDGPQSPEVEAHVNELAARLIITAQAFAEAETANGSNPLDLANALDVTPGIITSWQDHEARCH